MTALHQTEVDGVRCFWVETGRPTLAAALMFRHGLADEPLTESGFTHLLEHLSLHDRGGGALHVNGAVRLLETVYDAHGPADQVAAHLESLTAWLSAPTFAEIDRERKVLAAEAAVRGEGPSTRALAWRYGARGPGVVLYGEPGLGRATPELLTERAHQVFTRGNATLALDGPPPVGLRLTLPEGERQPVRTAVSVETRFPAMYVDEAGLVLSGVVPRGAPAVIAAELLRRTLQERLRHEEGAAYAPWSLYERVDPELSVLMGGSDIRPEALSTLADTTLDLTRSLVREPDPSAIAEVTDSFSQGIRDPYAQFGLATRAAAAVLHGKEAETADQVLAELLAVSPEDLVTTLQRFLDTMLVGLPGQTAWRDQMRTLTAPMTVPAVKGRRHRSRDWPADRARLVIGDDAVEVSAGREARVAPYARVEGVLAHENGLRTLVSPDGYVITVNPHVWQAGTEAVRRLDEVTPPSKLLPMPAVPGIDQVTRLGPLDRWTRPVRDRLKNDEVRRGALFVGGVAVIIGGIALAVVLSIAAMAAAAVVGGIAMIRGAVSD